MAGVILKDSSVSGLMAEAGVLRSQRGGGGGLWAGWPLCALCGLGSKREHLMVGGRKGNGSCVALHDLASKVT